MIDDRISDDDLRQLLESAAAEHPVPDDGVEGVLAARNRLAKPRRAGRVSRPALRKWAPATVLAVGVLVGGVVAIGVQSDPESAASRSSSGSEAGTSSSTSSDTSSGSAGGSAAAPAPSRAAPTTVPTSAPRPPGAGVRIVQTGSISLVVDDRTSGPTVDRVGGVARGLGGYVADSSAQSGASGGAAITLRVPAAAFDQTVAQVAGLGRVTRSTTNAQDVTGQYVDLTARIRALQTTRDTYVRLLARAGSIDDTLAVQQQITSVQTQIEQLQGEQQVLADRSDLATLSVDISEPTVSRPTEDDEDGFSGAWHRAGRSFTGGLEWLVAASGPVLLVALIGLVLFWPVRRLVRLLRRQLI